MAVRSDWLPALVASSACCEDSVGWRGSMILLLSAPYIVVGVSAA